MEDQIRRESQGVGGDAPQGLGAALIYSEAPEAKHNKKTARPRQHLPLRARHNMFCLQRLLISCLYKYVLHIKLRHMQNSVTQSTACRST